MKPLVISAAPFELDASLLDQSSKLDYFSFGVGIFEASYCMHKAQALAKDRDVLFVGSAGIFGEFDQPTLYCASEVHWLPLAQRQGLAYSVAGTQDPIRLNPRNNIQASLAPATVVCASVISLDDKFSQSSKPNGKTLLENIELYAVAKYLMPVCQSFSAILCSTNAIGTTAHEQWRQNHPLAATASSRFLIDQIEKG